MRKSHFRVALAGLLVLASSGCSFIFVDGPPDVPPNMSYGDLNYFNCTEPNTWPILDAIWAGLNGVGALMAMGGDETQFEDPEQTVLVGLVWLGVSGAASYVGFQRTSECRAAKAEWHQANRGQGSGSGVMLDFRSELLPQEPAPPVLHPH